MSFLIKLLNSGVTLSLVTNAEGMDADKCLLSKSLGVLPVKGALPVHNSKSMQPIE